MTKDDGPPRAPSRATSSDVARRAGVSRATVSYVLNNSAGHRISGATRQLVLEAAAELGHLPDANARALRAGRSNLVLVLVPGYTVGLLFEVLLDRLDEALTGRGYGLVVHRHSDAGLTITELWGLVNPAIVIVLGGLSSEEMDSFSRSPARFIRIDQVVSDVAVGRTQAEYLLSRGHTRIGFAGPVDPALSVFAAGRLEGISEFCAERDLQPPVACELTLHPSDAARAIEIWVEAGVTAVAAHNDDYGLVLLAAFRLRGGEWPLAVIGADDLPMAALGLTTIGFDTDDVGTQLVASVFAALEGDPLPAPRPAQLTIVARDSA